MLPLRCIAQNYEWGRAAASSEVAKLSKANGSDIDESKPFAELWMGTHPNCPSLVASTGGKLKDWIAQHPQVLGDKVQRCFKNDLPYLFKVLSVAKALSIQSHPDKRLAEKLHAEHPKMYADDNHKPEMALALSDFEALCGFVSTEELRVALATVPELRACVGEGPSKGFEECTPETSKKALRAAFTSLMTADAKLVSEQISALVARVEGALAAGREPTPKEKLALRLNGQFPLDVGVLSCFFLNHISLEDGQAIYLAANEPHAYLAGELMECMAASDNVIRAGLTPKFKHVDVLCSSLTYEQGLPTIMSGTAANDSVFIFRPPFEEFEMHKVQVAAGAGGTVPPNEGPRILLVQHGRCTATAVLPESLAGDVLPELLTKAELARGSIVFVPAATTITIDAQEAVTAWAAATNGNFFTLQDVRDSAAAKANGTEKVAELVAA